MPKSKIVAHLVQISREGSNDQADRVFYAVLTAEADDALRLVEAFCGEGESASLAGGFLSISTARALALRPDQPRRL